MSIEYKDKVALSKNLIHKPEVYISDIEQNYFQDSETGEWEEVEYQQYGEIRFKPSQKALINLFENVKVELKKNGYIDGFVTYKYVKELYDEIHPVSNEFLDLRKTKYGIFNFRNGINIFYEYYPELNPKHIEDLDILPKEALEKIQDYCQFQKKTIHDIIQYLNGLIPQDLVNDDLVEFIKDESDSRIFIKKGPKYVRAYFSLLSEKTISGRSILSKEDFEYFLRKNFQGFKPVTEDRSLTFDLIDRKHFQQLLFIFYQRNSDLKEYNREHWAKLLKDTFPTKFTAKLSTYVSHFKHEKHEETSSKLISLGLEFPK